VEDTTDAGDDRDLRPPDAGDGGHRDRWLDERCDWAWTAVVSPLLKHLGADVIDATVAPGRVVLVPVGVLGSVPWHAARQSTSDGRHRYACEFVEVSYAASARQLADTVSREPMTRHDDVVLVADPTGGLAGALDEVRVLREEIYPRALVLDTGTPAQVLAHLPGRVATGAALLHLACHARAGLAPDRTYLQLASLADPATESQLSVARILEHARGRSPGAPGGLVVLAACTTDLAAAAYDEVLTLATAFVAAGAVGVVGSGWVVDDRITVYLMYMFHHYLEVEGLSASGALRRAQLWMLDPDRHLPAGLAALPKGVPDRLAVVESWAAFRYHGR
jgi:CHAT domain-containing protein